MSEITRQTNQQVVDVTKEDDKRNGALAVDINSITASVAGVEFGSIVRELRKACTNRIIYYIIILKMKG